MHKSLKMRFYKIVLLISSQYTFIDWLSAEFKTIFEVKMSLFHVDITDITNPTPYLVAERVYFLK